MEEKPLETPEVPQEMPVIPEKETVTPGPRSRFFTFNLNTILMLVMLAGLIVLYVLFFTGQKGAGEAVPAASFGHGLKMVYVNVDTLNQKYQFVVDLKKNLESMGGKLQNELLAEQAALQKEFNDLQKLIAGNVVTEERANTIYQGLLQKQQALDEKKNKYTQEVAEKEYNTQMQLLDTVDNFLKRFNAKYHYDYILSYKSGGDLLIANDTLDITALVVDELNKEYKAQQKK